MLMMMLSLEPKAQSFSPPRPTHTPCSAVRHVLQMFCVFNPNALETFLRLQQNRSSFRRFAPLQLTVANSSWMLYMQFVANLRSPAGKVFSYPIITVRRIKGENRQRVKKTNPGSTHKCHQLFNTVNPVCLAQPTVGWQVTSLHHGQCAPADRPPLQRPSWQSGKVTTPAADS